MEFIEIVRLIAKEGMGSVAIAAGIWMLYYLIKHLISSVTSGLNSLVQDSKVFYKKVREEHEDAMKGRELIRQQTVEDHKELMRQHREVTEILKGINNRVK